MLALQAGDASLVLAPELGGSIFGWARGEVALLRHVAPRAMIPGDVRVMASFPLVPYSNRIARAHFRFAGAAYRLALHPGDHPHSIHGIGWRRAWLVSDVTADAATLTLDHLPDADWPFAFSAEQRFRLSASELHVTLAITNHHTGPTPAGLGLHPYFPRDGARLRFHADAVWRNGVDYLPGARVEVPPEWDHAAGRKVGDVVLDNCFEGWDGTTELTWPDHRITIEGSDIFRHLIVYTPQGQDFFCVEPVSHMTDAINRGSMHVLARGETLRGEISFRVG